MQREQVEHIFEQVGPILDPFELRHFPNENAWGIQLDEATAVLVDWDESGKLVLSCDLGTPPPGERGKLYELMLTYNFLWNQTGGARLALDAPDGNVVLVRDCLVAGLDATGLSQEVAAFSKLAEIWRRLVERGAASVEDDAPMGEDAIRV